MTYKCEADSNYAEHWWQYPMYIQYHPTFHDGSYLLATGSIYLDSFVLLGVRSPNFRPRNLNLPNGTFEAEINY